jgi:TonB family protein
MKLDVIKFRRRANIGSLGALLLCLMFFLTLGWAQEAPRQEGSTQIKPPMIKPPMQRSRNTNSGSVNSSRRRKRRSKRRTHRRAKVTAQPREFIEVLPTVEATRETDSFTKVKPTTENSDNTSPVTSTRRTTPISGGILNGKAVSLPKPLYPAIARAAHASGTVVVQVLIDEEGNVTEARAISGHPLLQAAAIEAARQAKFTPTRLEGQPVKVTGTLTYNFVL